MSQFSFFLPVFAFRAPIHPYALRRGKFGVFAFQEGRRHTDVSLPIQAQICGCFMKLPQSTVDPDQRPSSNRHDYSSSHDGSLMLHARVRLT